MINWRRVVGRSVLIVISGAVTIAVVCAIAAFVVKAVSTNGHCLAIYEQHKHDADLFLVGLPDSCSSFLFLRGVAIGLALVVGVCCFIGLLWWFLELMWNWSGWGKQVEK